MKSSTHSGDRESWHLEALENRLMMNGNVLALLQSGDLIVRGDADDNQFVMSRRSTGAIRIKGLEDTTINGKKSVDLPQPSDDLMILMQQGGEDHVSIQGRFIVRAVMSAQLGAGELLVEG